MPPEFSGLPAYTEVLQSVFDIRDKLGVGSKKKNRIRRPGRGRKGKDGDDDNASAYSAAVSTRTGDIPEIDDRFDNEPDFLVFGDKKRSYSKVKKPTIDLLGVGNYDQCKNLGELNFKMERAHRRYVRKLKTRDNSRIRRVVELGLVRDVRSIIIRNSAIAWRERQKQLGGFDMSRSEGRNSSLNQTGKSYSPVKSILGGSPLKSPTKLGTPSNARRGNDSFRIGGLKSEFGDRSDAKSGYGSPTKAAISFKVGGDGPTAAKLSKLPQGKDDLDTKSVRTNRSEDYEALDLEEIGQKILETETELVQKRSEANKLVKKELGKATTKTMKEAAERKAHQMNKPLYNQIAQLESKIQHLEIIKEAKIPLHEKLPQESIFTKHYLNLMFTQKVEKAADEQVAQDAQLMSSIKQDIKQ